MNHLTRFILLVIFTLTLNTVTAQGIGINNPAPDSTAALDIASNNKGVLIPRMTTAERLVIGGGTPAVGLIVYDSNTNSFWFWNDTNWREIGNDTDWTETSAEVYTTKNAAIGLTSAARTLDVGGANAQYIRVRSTNGTTNGMEFMREGAGTDWRLLNSGDYFDVSSSTDEFSSNTIHATITSDGEFGVGVLFPARILDVGGDGTQYMRVRSTNGTTNGIEFMRQGTGTDWRFTNASSYFDISSSTDDFATNDIHATFTSAGRLGIGTLSPAKELHVIGTIRSNDLAGVGNRPIVANSSGDLVLSGAPATQTWSVNGYAFFSSSTSFVYGSIAYCTSGSLGMSATVNLPQGATVTSVVISYGDDNASVNLRVRLLKLDIPGNFTAATLSEFISSGTPGAVSLHTDSTIISPDIDNTTGTYILLVNSSGGSWSDGINIRSVRINYTMP